MPPVTDNRSTLSSPQQELSAIAKCVRALESLDPASQRRAATYIADRYGVISTETIEER